MYQDLGIPMKIETQSDSSTANSLGDRLGAGQRTKHTDTRYFWIFKNTPRRKPQFQEGASSEELRRCWNKTSLCFSTTTTLQVCRGQQPRYTHKKNKNQEHRNRRLSTLIVNIETDVQAEWNQWMVDKFERFSRCTDHDSNRKKKSKGKEQSNGKHNTKFWTRTDRPTWRITFRAHKCAMMTERADVSFSGPSCVGTVKCLILPRLWAHESCIKRCSPRERRSDKIRTCCRQWHDSARCTYLHSCFQSHSPGHLFSVVHRHWRTPHEWLKTKTHGILWQTVILFHQECSNMQIGVFSLKCFQWVLFFLFCHFFVSVNFEIFLNTYHAASLKTRCAALVSRTFWTEASPCQPALRICRFGEAWSQQPGCQMKVLGHMSVHCERCPVYCWVIWVEEFHSKIIPLAHDVSRCGRSRGTDSPLLQVEDIGMNRHAMWHWISLSSLVFQTQIDFRHGHRRFQSVRVSMFCFVKVCVCCPRSHTCQPYMGSVVADSL